MSEKKYRHELKYLISAAQIPILKTRIAAIMQPDAHAGADGTYAIRSLYFDDYANRCYYENIGGVDPREKFRIRIYNGSSARISLECKRKERGKTLKTACRLSEEQAQALIAGRIPETIDHPLLQKLALDIRMRGMRPVVIVEYDRIPYVYREGNVRVTFDTNIASSADFAHFFDERLHRRPVMPAGQHLLEVKFDEYLPDHIYRSLNLSSLQQTAFSKYCLARKYALVK